MKKIKIAFFAEILIEDFDGASRTMFQIIKRIPDEQFEFLFICGKGPEKISGFDCIAVPTVTLPVNHHYTMALPYLAEEKLNRKLAGFGPDIIHIATPSLLGSFALKYARENHLPVLTIYHTHFISYLDYYLSKTPFLINFAKSKMISTQRNFYNYCDIIYVPSESIAFEMQHMGIEQHRIKIWKRGIDTTLFSPHKRNVGSLRLLTKNNRINILFASRLVWEKNLETLIRIYDYCESKNLDFNFIIAGSGTAMKACRQRMKNAFFTGSLSHEKLSELYASADIFLFTSVTETYGNVVLEAMASGLPCVIADGGGSQDFINQGINGFKCQPENEADYVEKIQTLIRNNALREMISDNGRRYSLGFDWNKLTNIYFDELHNLAGILHA
ncbi:glycosyltransferase family 1 protein [Dyadobacter flavalbus]|uniref:Glycosyltransferase family 1 protein n=1 Tax=Dyadobacter flavalbus TaxID=2579942 RepID=A0A5M8QU81_9BACT|nr:glycosyltransferase [Dyadobacter flavalbus]KAA6438384.1 glycosyltransferase family 1 protein [Dyadobacter flavalbus]